MPPHGILDQPCLIIGLYCTIMVNVDLLLVFDRVHHAPEIVVARIIRLLPHLPILSIIWPLQLVRCILHRIVFAQIKIMQRLVLKLIERDLRQRRVHIPENGLPHFVKRSFIFYIALRFLPFRHLFAIVFDAGAPAVILGAPLDEYLGIFVYQVECGQHEDGFHCRLRIAIILNRLVLLSLPV